VRARRTGIDKEFAQRLAVWTEGASQQATGVPCSSRTLLVRAAVPLSRPLKRDDVVQGREQSRPLVLVLDGMSADVAVQLVDGLDRRVWTEVVPKPERGERATRRAAVSMLRP